MFCGAKIPVSNRSIRPIAGRIHASRNAFFLESILVTFGKIIRPTTSAMEALIINAESIPLLLQT